MRSRNAVKLQKRRQRGDGYGIQKIRVLIVDDSAVVRQTLREVLSSDPEIEVIATAGDPFVAAERIAEQVPDVITLDIEMPRMDGLTFLKKIMSQHPDSGGDLFEPGRGGRAEHFKALEYGAVEIITKPRLGTKQFLEDSRIDALRCGEGRGGRKAAHARPSHTVEPKLTADAFSPPPRTPWPRPRRRWCHRRLDRRHGGAEDVLEALPADTPGIVIVQHMPELFTRAFANRLDGLCAITVKEAETNDTVIRGRALIAPGNHHLLLKRSGARYYVEIKDGPLVCRHRPSVDVLFRSAARYAGQNASASS
jgi:two-component system, chemotaxis family, protein-glutamate methylesterase/glutaminase